MADRRNSSAFGSSFRTATSRIIELFPDFDVPFVVDLPWEYVTPFCFSVKIIDESKRSLKLLKRRNHVRKTD